MPRFSRSDDAGIQAEVERRLREALVVAFGGRLTLAQVAHRLGCSERTATREIDAGVAPRGKLTGRHRTWTLEDVGVWRERREVARTTVRVARAERARAALAKAEAALAEPGARARAVEKARATMAARRRGSTQPIHPAPGTSQKDAPDRRPTSASSEVAP